MITLFHSPRSRSTRVLWLLEELDATSEVTVELVTVKRADGSGGIDPNNPHPDGKVPALDHDGSIVTESGAIFLYLTDMFPNSGMGRNIGDPQRGEYLTWLHYYGGVMEPVLIMHMSPMTPDKLFHGAFRGFEEMTERLTRVLSTSDYLLGDKFSAADLLIATPFIWFPAMAPDTQPVKDWLARCSQRPGFKAAMDADARYLEEG